MLQPGPKSGHQTETGSGPSHRHAVTEEVSNLKALEGTMRRKIAGPIKMIYQDPITELKPEGKAWLVRKIGEDRLSDTHILETWTVRFVEDDPPAAHYQRRIKVAATKNLAVL